MKKLILLIIILLTTGCADYRELSDMAMVSNIAISKEEEKYRIIVQVLDAKSTNEESIIKPSVILYENTGNTMHEAYRNVTLESPKKLYLGQVDTIILSTESLKEGASDFIDFILRDPEMEKDFNLLITDEDINEVMNVVPPLVSIPSENVSSSIIIASKMQGMVANVSFDEFISNILVEGIDPVVPSMYIKKVDTENEESNPEKRLVISKELGIFKGDKFISYINEDASLGFNLLNNNVSSPVISFKCDETNYASIELIKNKASYKYDKDSNKLKIDIDLTGTLSELDCNIDISKKEGVTKIEDLLKNKVNEIIKETVKAEKENKSDFLGIGKFLYQNDYKYYTKTKDNLDEIINNMNEEININVTYSQKASIKRGDEKF